MAQETIFEGVSFLNIGTSLFRDHIEKQGRACGQVDWKPIAGGNVELINALDQLMEDPKIDAANQIVAGKIKAARPVLVDMDTALAVIPGMTPKTILHAGPPIGYADMCGPMKGAVIGALIYEGLAETHEQADKLAASGQITFAPCHEHSAVGPMAGIISPSMPVHVVKNETDGNMSYATVNEGLGKVLRYGANSQEVLERLAYIRDGFAPIMKQILKAVGGIDLKNLIAQSLHMGDECHNRNKAATSLFIREILPYLMGLDLDGAEAKKAMEFLNGNDHYFLNLSMAACKCTLDAAHGVEHSTIVTTMARNGVEFGLRVSGMPADMWFTGPALMVEGLMFPGFDQEDANPDIGDSAITETMGIGGFAMAAAPSIVQFVGGRVADALSYSKQMYEITQAENSGFALPALDFRGTALGIDIRKVIATGILPIINTGMAHKEAGIGQVGAGLVHPPMVCFEKALLSFESRTK